MESLIVRTNGPGKALVNGARGEWLQDEWLAGPVDADRCYRNSCDSRKPFNPLVLHRAIRLALNGLDHHLKALAHNSP